ncbi:symmetrical bis(5'-nucleosyl)-tetraphosphatase [Alteromonas sp. ASW11-36]|uniref:bis(5'-nucleosyl)-tetraphosphatase (symmetrical) n=1 Tax=Alteromonas arenosi TaxID=3055817 RepID=A0ABT7T032_9ALTE|nr:symmetrical bis(5'-nucleosyl)-tetraphosphatase [Alteromonas sp. ASW11-36]MDM7861806.1 symmetrical bis(5'-nucleosyl)-tetraphosphatase [Alteromonas sp. ASW11-36]
MANYIVGDIQGCYTALQKLLKKVNFNPAHDTLWAVGDLVARGDDSLSTLDFLYDLGDSFQTVLGNHDLHLLAISQGIRGAKRNDNLDKLLRAKSLPRLLDWLRQKPLARMIDKNTLLVHAGLYPKWSFQDCLKYSDSVTKRLRSDKLHDFLQNMYGDAPKNLDSAANGVEKRRFYVNAMTRMRFVDADLNLDLSIKVSPLQAPKGFAPWFTIPNPERKKKQRIVFGHWAALNGLLHDPLNIGLDTGYVWGGSLTALRLEDMKFFAYNKQS